MTRRKKKEERRPTYVEVEEIRIKTVDGTEDSDPAQSAPAGTEHLEHEDEFQEATENLEVQPEESTQDEDAENNQYIKWMRDHPMEQVIGELNTGVKTRRGTQEEALFSCYVSQQEPSSIKEALEDSNWITAMQEELNQFERNKVWELVDRPTHMKAIGTKWVFKNKMDEHGVITRTKQD